MGGSHSTPQDIVEIKLNDVLMDREFHSALRENYMPIPTSCLTRLEDLQISFSPQYGTEVGNFISKILDLSQDLRDILKETKGYCGSAIRLLDLILRGHEESAINHQRASIFETILASMKTLEYRLKECRTKLSKANDVLKNLTTLVIQQKTKAPSESNAAKFEIARAQGFIILAGSYVNSVLDTGVKLESECQQLLTALRSSENGINCRAQNAKDLAIKLQSL